MKNKPKPILFGHVAEFRNGLNFSKASRGTGCVLIGIPDFKDRFSPDYDSLAEINPEGVARPDDYIRKNDILFVRSNGNKELVGRSLFIDRDVTALFSGFCIRARIHSEFVDPLFCAYFTRTAYFKSSISSHAGTNINNLNQSILGDVEMPAFPIASQQAIAHVLSALDDKIALNHRINAELEAMAKLLYDYWFVQFDFPISAAQAGALGKPGLEGQPYRSSGGKMTYEPDLKREIPAGWKVSTIGETFTTHLGGTPSRKEPSYWEPGEVAWLSSGDKVQLFVCAPDEWISRKGLANSPATLLPKGSVILSIVRHIRASILATDAATNQSVLGIKETASIKHCFIYPFILAEIPRFMMLRTGAQQPHINKGIVDVTPFVIPDDEVLKAYSAIAAPLFEQIQNLQQQNQELAALRDWLLPMLMNGQVRVG